MRPPGHQRAPVFGQVEGGYLPTILDQIEELAIVKANGPNYTYIDVVRAFEDYFGDQEPPPKITILGFVQDNLFIIICALLALVFGYMGQTGADVKGDAAKGFLDIAKIFAGALV